LNSVCSAVAVRNSGLFQTQAAVTWSGNL